MNIKPIAKICMGQDGAVWGPFLFRFKSDGECCVYELDRLIVAGDEEVETYARFRLDKSDVIMPHSNAVAFGSEYAEEGDAFPLLYTNIYNSYAKAEDRLEGICCVYRLWQEDSQFHTELMQLIEVDFTADPTLWCSAGGVDVRPYGNFTVDRSSGKYYAFTMRDEDNMTRYFAFQLPKSSAGQIDARFGVRKVVLSVEDIMGSFDCPYHHYIQGACVHESRLYSLEGFTNNPQSPPAMRIIDLEQRCEIAMIMFGDFGLEVEPELIDFYGDRCLYADHRGNVYEIFFDNIKFTQ